MNEYETVGEFIKRYIVPKANFDKSSQDDDVIIVQRSELI